MTHHRQASLKSRDVNLLRRRKNSIVSFAGNIWPDNNPREGGHWRMCDVKSSCDDITEHYDVILNLKDDHCDSWAGNRAIYEVSNDLGLFWARLSFWLRVRFQNCNFCRFCKVCHPSVIWVSSSPVRSLVIRHMSSLVPMMTRNNRDQTLTKLLIQPDQSLSSGGVY